MLEKYQQTRLWESTLAIQAGEDRHGRERERLRSSFVSFRDRVILLAGEIHRALPDYTVHDITHLDALWDIAELVAGPEFQLTPTEAYVLGGVFLLHDLGMGLASYPDGIDDLKKERSWNDAVVKEFSSRLNRAPSAAEVENPPRDIQDSVVATLLRILHARHAETLATSPWRLHADDPPQYLIEDTELRQALGRTIGRIAHSHWWTVDRIDLEFTRTLGAPYWCPREWTVDPLKIACLLRLSDAAHIDARRAPMFLRRIRRPTPVSDEHWNFQEKLQKPQISEDALVFTSGYAFTFAEASSWWLCLDTLEMIDEELRRVDALLADRKLLRFAARRVAGVDSPERLVAYIPTDDWLPVDATLQVNDLPRVIETLGGTELYGRDLRVPLRELIQNAADAVRARRIVDRRSGEWGEITVALVGANDQEWIEVGDTGIGMSRDVLTRYLLDFGTTYWRSNLMLSEFPGLLTSGFEPTGEYGIGFFSTFMLGNHVSVITRRYDAAQAETQVLEFSAGVSGRPILRPAREQERLREGGTLVRVRLRGPAAGEGGLLWHYGDRRLTLAELCAKIAPAVDVDLVACEYGKQAVPAVKASDWQTIPATELLQRAYDFQERSEEDLDPGSGQVQKIAANIRTISDGEQIFGRACIVSDTYIGDYASPGVVTVGGLSASPLHHIAGLLVGMSSRAARDVARPSVPASVLGAWATEQASLCSKLYDEQKLLGIASVVWACGGELGSLPVCVTRAGYRTWQQLLEDFSGEQEVLVGSIYTAERIRELLPDVEFAPNVVFIDNGIYTGIRSIRSNDFWPIDMHLRWSPSLMWTMRSLTGAIISALSEAWGIPVEVLAKPIEEYRVQRVIASASGRDLTEMVSVFVREPRL